MSSRHEPNQPVYFQASLTQYRALWYTRYLVQHYARMPTGGRDGRCVPAILNKTCTEARRCIQSGRCRLMRTTLTERRTLRSRTDGITTHSHGNYSSSNPNSSVQIHHVPSRPSNYTTKVSNQSNTEMKNNYALTTIKKCHHNRVCSAFLDMYFSSSHSIRERVSSDCPYPPNT